MTAKKASIIPVIHYKNAKAAIEWICESFGFEKHLIVSGEDNTIVHAQLTYGNSMIMLSSENNNEYGKLINTPNSMSGINTQAPYIVVEKVDEHYKNAIAKGVKILIEIKDEAYGGRGYTCMDIEGHIWSFGSYNPWS
ncbi:glyoxalase [Flavobacteriaceae bacterium S0825]|uniref:VOC family protein n=1 Tax=Gaetbulibacter sp. S0825 TaxID=2720084 RepID=UPI00142FBE81|nr:VOC family protein [Gaetbulibacter sp. S0825]MCK0110493.1 glyoxalase [Flavobacteriaceae bacterium S0825]NIX66122.1 glyoxalase [Gaetbulibacter sp. S0825]